jgi:hypothetical protein
MINNDEKKKKDNDGNALAKVVAALQMRKVLRHMGRLV